MGNKDILNISGWFVDRDKNDSSLGLFDVPDDNIKNGWTPFEKLKDTIELLEDRSLHTLKNCKFGMFSQSKKLIKQLHSNFKKYSSKLPDHELFKDFSPQEKLKKMTEVEKLIESDNKKIAVLYSKIYNKYKDKYKDKDKDKDKDEKKRPRIIELDNEKNLFEGLDDLLKFAKKCVDKQRTLLMNETKKGQKDLISAKYDENTDTFNEEYTESKIEKLAKAFTDEKNLFGNSFIYVFPKNETVKEYIKKRLSKTGKLLKDICKFINSCDKAFGALDTNILKTLYSCKEVNNNISSVESFQKITNDENNYNKYISQLNTAIDAYNLLVGLLDSIAKYRGKMTNLISLYDPRVQKNIKELVKKLHNQIEMYKEMKIILEEKMKRKSMKVQ